MIVLIRVTTASKNDHHSPLKQKGDMTPKEHIHIAAEPQIPRLVCQALAVELRRNPLRQDLVLHLLV